MSKDSIKPLLNITEEERDKLIYELVELCDDNLDPTGEKFYRIKSGIQVFDYLLPDEVDLWNSLSEIDQIRVIMCTDPISLLRDMLKGTYDQ